MSKLKDKLDCQYEGDSFVQGILGGLGFAMLLGCLLLIIYLVLRA